MERSLHLVLRDIPSMELLYLPENLYEKNDPIKMKGFVKMVVFLATFFLVIVVLLARPAFSFAQSSS